MAQSWFWGSQVAVKKIYISLSSQFLKVYSLCLTYIDSLTETDQTQQKLY